MRFRVYSYPRGSEPIPASELDRMLFKECGSLDEAMSWARHVIRSEHVVHLIEGDDGTHLVKQEIAAALRHAEDELPS